MLDDLLNIFIDENPLLLKFYLEKAIVKIRKYLNKPKIEDKYIIDNFKTAIITAVGEEIENSKHKNIKSFKEGDQSISYINASNSLSNEVKELLPSPSIRLI